MLVPSQDVLKSKDKENYDSQVTSIFGCFFFLLHSEDFTKVNKTLYKM